MDLKCKKNNVVSILLSIILLLVIGNTSVIAETTETMLVKDVTNDSKVDDARKETLMFYSRSDGDIALSLATEFELEISKINKLKEEERTWINVYHNLIGKRKNVIALDYKTVLDMHEKGIQIDDIAKSELLSAVSGLTIEELLDAKGSTNNYKIEIQEHKDGSISYKTIDLRDELWSMVIKSLDIDMELIIIKMGIAYEDIQQMREQDYSDYTIFNMAYTAMEYNTSYEKIKKDMLNGTSLKRIISKLKRDKFYSKEGK